MTDLLFEPLTTNERYEHAPFQLEDLDYLEKMDASANFSEMGTYKTTTGLWLIDRKLYRRKSPNVLIITSKNGKGTYYDAFPKTIPDWPVYNVRIKGTTQMIGDIEFPIHKPLAEIALQKGRKIFLAHYDCFVSKSPLRPHLLKLAWEFVLCDEAHRLKNQDTQWTRGIKKLKAEFKHLMTGTGFINNPAEIWSLLNWLGDEKVPYVNAYWSFRNYFCDEYRGDNGYRTILGVKEGRVEEFRALRKSVGPRRYMREVHPNIGKPIEAAYDVDLNATQRKMYDEIKKVLRTLDLKGEPLMSPTVLSQLTRLRQICVATPEVISSEYDEKQDRLVTKIRLTEPSSKLDKVMDLLEEIDEAKVVVFSNFKDPLYLLAERLDKKHIPFLHMEQKHNDRQRYELWHDIFPSSDARVFMSTIALGGESINLTPAQYLIFLDKSWSPKDMMQAIGRVYRPGQTGIPEIIYINGRKTVDQYISGKLQVKGHWFTSIFGPDV